MADKTKEFQIDGKNLSTLRVVDLKQELDKRGLSKSGSKKELADRLKVQLQLEKLHESASTDEGHVPNLKLQDEMVEQNDLIKDYLAQQQQIYAVQKENRRRVELEEQRTRDSEASAGDTSQEEEEVEQPSVKVNEEVPTVAVVASPPSKDIDREDADDLRPTRGRRSSGTPAKVDADARGQRESRSRKRSSDSEKIPEAIAGKSQPSDKNDAADESDVSQKPNEAAIEVDTPEPAPPDKGESSATGGAGKIEESGDTIASPDLKKTETKLECEADSSPPTRMESAVSHVSPTSSVSRITRGKVDQSDAIIGTETPSVSSEQSTSKRPRLKRLGSQPAEDIRRSRASQVAAVPEALPEEDKQREGSDEKREAECSGDLSDKRSDARSADVNAAIGEDQENLSAGVAGVRGDADAKEEHLDSPNSEERRSRAAKTAMGTNAEDFGDASVAQAKDEPGDAPAKGESCSQSRASSGSRSRSPPTRGRRHSRQSVSGRSSSSGSSSSSSSRSRDRRGPRASRSESSSGSDSRSASRSVSPVSKNVEVKDDNSQSDVKNNDESARSSPPRLQPEQMDTDGPDRTAEPIDESSSSSLTAEAATRRQHADSEKVAGEVIRAKEEPAKVSSRKISISSLKDKQTKKEEVEDGDGGSKPPQRKRRWGGGGSASTTVGGKKISLSINTDSLKNLIPDVKPPSALIADSSMDNQSEGELEEDESPGQEDAVTTAAKSPDTNPTTPSVAMAGPAEETDVASKRDQTQLKREIKPPPKNEVAAPKREQVIFRTVTQVVKDKVPTTAADKRIFSNRIITSPNDVDAIAARRSPSPARFPPTQYLHIKNLVRPFTLNQLKELLSKTGTLVEGQFWIDKIKSKCYVMYELQEQAVGTRQCLHGVSWPSSNPKRLIVDFSNKEELDYHCQLTDAVDVKRTVDTRGQVVVKEESRGRITATVPSRSKPDTPDVADVPERKRRDSRREPLRPSQDQAANRMDRHRRLGTKDGRTDEDGGSGVKPPPVREWDKDKIGERSPGERARASRHRNRQLSFSRSRSRSPRARKTSPLHPIPPGGRDAATVAEGRKGERDRNRAPGPREHRADKRAERHREEEAPAKLLDDLFHKTKTTPCIYWLPLTVDQIKLRAEQRQQRRQQVLELEKKNRTGGGSGGGSNNVVEQTAKKSREMEGNRNRRRSVSTSRTRGRKR